MIRVKRGVCKRARHKKWLSRCKGYYGRASTCQTIGRSRFEMGQQHAYRHRKIFRRTQRALWIARINAAARELGITYSRFISGVQKIGCDWNRKILSAFAVEGYKNNTNGFAELTQKVKDYYAQERA